MVAALNLKEIPYDIRPVSLIKAGGEQHSNEYREVNPMEQLPALQIDGATLVESLSILHYLEETRPQRPLLPLDPVKRAKVMSGLSFLYHWNLVSVEAVVRGIVVAFFISLELVPRSERSAK